MYERILVPTDGSACSEAALGEACRLAKALGSRLTLLHAIDVLALARDGMVTIVEVHRELRDAGAALVARGKEIARREGLEAEGVVCDGSPLEEIVRASERFDLVVMGRHGHGVVHRMLVGSVTAAVLHLSARPVLVVPRP